MNVAGRGTAGHAGTRRESPAPGNAHDAGIALVISTLGAGGAERVLTTMASWWARRGVRVTVVTVATSDTQSFHALDEAVERRGIGLLADAATPLHGVVNNLRRVSRLRRILRGLPRGPVIGFGTETNCLLVAAALGTRRRVVVSERCDPRFVPARRPWRWLRRALYPLADVLAVQSRDAAAFFPWARDVRIVPNPVSMPPRSPCAEAGPADPSPGCRPLVLAMGRLTEQKGFDCLIRAFASVAGRFPDWSLRILGEGPLRPALERLVADEGLEGRASLPGLTRAPFDALRQADLFVLPSRFEGFPNALCEAMLCGLPVIATDCPSGPSEIVRDGIDGRLVPVDDVPALARAMQDLMGDAARRRELGRRAGEIGERFSLDRVMGEWERIVTGRNAAMPVA